MKTKTNKIDKPTEAYRFVKKYYVDGCIISAGVTIKGPCVIANNCVSFVGSEMLKDIPMEYLEKYALPVMEKKKRAKTKVEPEKEKKSKSENSRVSDYVEGLKKNG
jgi:hypothetical protein